MVKYQYESLALEYLDRQYSITYFSRTTKEGLRLDRGDKMGGK